MESALVPGLPSSSETTLAVVLVNTENRPPKFTSRRYIATVEENSPTLTPVMWEGPEIPKVLDDDQVKKVEQIFKIYVVNLGLQMLTYLGYF